MPLPENLERHLGQQQLQYRKQMQENQLPECPPIPPQLLAHLETMFSNPSKVAKPTHPQLGQLLMIQYGVDKVLNYLRGHYDQQTKAAREAHAI